MNMKIDPKAFDELIRDLSSPLPMIGGYNGEYVDEYLVLYTNRIAKEYLLILKDRVAELENKISET